METKVTASNLVKALRSLPKNRWYEYPTPATKTRVKIVRFDGTEGPVIVERYNPASGGTPIKAKKASMSANMLWRVAQNIQEGVPLNFDRVLGASYNMRSTLEALLAHTPEYYMCYPGRIEVNASSSQVKQGHKHLIWMPNEPHPVGELHTTEVEMVISEIPSVVNIYDAIDIPSTLVAGHQIDIQTKRRHIQIQLALVAIGEQLGFRTYVAKNDQGVIYDGKRIGELPGVIADLGDEKIVSAHADAIQEGRLIDCVWFKNGRLMPAVLEVEHSTGITSGLTRMKNFHSFLPPFPTRWTIVAPDEDRNKVIEKCNKPQFKGLKARYFPYSAVEELYSLCMRRKIKGVDDTFLDCFMENTVLNPN
ncbi:MAG: restriction endonuclease [Akkermansiaceae bacterium]|nr:restriction endonuclease [Akkermansiaceae bacterium]